MLKLNTCAALAVLVTSVTLTVPATSAFGQESAAAASTSKEAAKAQRRAARKAARVKKNAEISTLQKNGYNPSGANQNDYPQNVQDAERKARPAAPASVPN